MTRRVRASIGWFCGFALLAAACSGGDDTSVGTSEVAPEGKGDLAAQTTEGTSDDDTDDTASTTEPGDNETATVTSTSSPPTTAPRGTEVEYVTDPDTDDIVEVETEAEGPATYDEVVDFGIEAGLWDEVEGLTRVLGYVLGTTPAGEVPGSDEVLTTEMSDLLRRAHALGLAANTSDVELADLRRLYEMAIPGSETLTALADSAPNPAIQGFRSTPMSQCAPVDPVDFSGWAVVEGCYLVLESEVAGAKLRVFYPAWYEESPGLAELPELAEQSLVRSTQIYQPLGEIGDIDLVFSLVDTITTSREDEGSDGTAAVATHNSLWGEATYSGACPVTVFPSSFVGEGPFLQIVAHEVWHCVQHYSGFPQGVAAGTAWYHEGGAHYFSNVVYPSINFEHRWLGRFDRRSAKKSLFDLDYEAWVWWQWFANLSSPRAIADLHLELMQDGDGGVSGMKGWGEQFQQFVVEYVAGAIRDQSGDLLPRSTRWSASPKTVKKNDTGKTFDHEAEAYIARRWRIRYDKELRVFESDATTTQGGLAMVALADRSDLSAWKGVFPEVRAKCKKKVDYVIVATTDDQPHTAKIQIDRIEEAPCDPCVLGSWEMDLDTFETMLLNAMAREGGALPPDAAWNFSGHYYSSLEDDGIMKEQRDGLTATISAQGQDISFTIDSFAQGEFTADGERITISNPVELYLNVSTSIPGFGGVSLAQGSSMMGGAGGIYECRRDDMTVTIDGMDPLRFDRIDKILEPPTTVPG